ncbi:MAG: SsrA-binding protein SmpB [Bacteroidetes bacterium]|nr:MAG: SsrA-binding protein SmpB [Bacteroidota bacterium]
MKDKIEKSVNIRNKKASFEYHFLETYTAGIVLRGTEIKSIRQQKVNMQDAYCYVQDNSLRIKNFHISSYESGSWLNHDPLRERILLLKKKEIRKITSSLEDQGVTVIPTRIYISDRGFAKMEIAVAKGKKLYDKREDLKEKDSKREMKSIEF